MIGKVIVGLVITIVTGGLVLGAVNRTSSREVDGSRLAAGQHGSGSEEELNSGGYGGGRNGGQGEDKLPMTPGHQVEKTGDQGLSNRETAGKGVAVGIGGWIEESGTVTSIDPELLQVQLADGSLFEMSRRAWWFAQDQGFTASVGDQLNLTGFIEGDEFETAILENLTKGLIVKIRDEAGRPLWASRGG